MSIKHMGTRSLPRSRGHEYIGTCPYRFAVDFIDLPVEG